MTASREDKHFRELATWAAQAADDKKGEGIVLLHIRPISTLADYVLLVNVTSPAHLEAIEESIRLKLKAAGVCPQHRDGRQSELWRVLDYGGLIVHLLHPQAREFYALDKLFHEAHKIHWNGLAQKRLPRKNIAVIRTAR